MIDVDVASRAQRALLALVRHLSGLPPDEVPKALWWEAMQAEAALRCQLADHMLAASAAAEEDYA